MSELTLLETYKKLDQESLPWNLVSFGHFDFKVASSEQEVKIYRISKKICNDKIYFWLKTQQKRIYDLYAESHFAKAHPHPIPTSKCLQQITTFLSDLKNPFVFTANSPIIACEAMMDVWNEVSFLIETETEWIVFEWGTSA